MCKHYSQTITFVNHLLLCHLQTKQFFLKFLQELAFHLCYYTIVLDNSKECENFDFNYFHSTYYFLQKQFNTIWGILLFPIGKRSIEAKYTWWSLMLKY